MNLPIYSTFLIISQVCNFVLLILVAFIFFKVERMSGADDNRGNDDHKLKRKLGKKVSDQFSGQVNELVAAALESFNVQIKSEIGKISEESMSKLRGLSDFTQAQEATIGKETQFLVANNFSKVEKELEEYKKTQMAKIDHEISEIVSAAAKEVIGRAISAAEQEDLVNKSLERAKRDKFFT